MLYIIIFIFQLYDIYILKKKNIQNLKVNKNNLTLTFN